jgi:NifU-like protein
MGRAGSLTCGAAVRVSLCVDEAQRIADARFKAAGCSFLVASASFLTEQIKGKSTGEAAALAQSSTNAIVEPFGGLPADRLHCAGMVCQALVSAVKSFSDLARDEWEGDEALICTCFCVSEGTIERVIAQCGLHTIAEVTQACNAGDGCRSCCSLIEDILDDHWRTAGTGEVRQNHNSTMTNSRL